MVLICSMAPLTTKYQTCIYIFCKERVKLKNSRECATAQVHTVDETNTILVTSRNVFSLRHVGYYPAHVLHWPNPKICDWQQMWNKCNKCHESKFWTLCMCLWYWGWKVPHLTAYKICQHLRWTTANHLGGGLFPYVSKSCNLPIKYEVFGLKWWLGIAGIKAGTSYHDSAVMHPNQNWPYLQYSC